MTATQDGYDWPNNVQDERWPADKYQPAAPYFREQLQESAEECSCMACRLPFRTHGCRCRSTSVVPPITRYLVRNVGE